MQASVLAALLALSTTAQAATQRTDIARPTDFAPVAASGGKECRSSKLMVCGRQAAGRLQPPVGSAPKAAYRFAEEEFLFDSGVGIFLQTAVAAQKGRNAPMEWRRRLAFKRAPNGTYQLVQVGIQYRCAGGEWQKTACKAGKPAPADAAVAAGARGAGAGQAAGATATQAAAAGSAAAVTPRGAGSSGSGDAGGGVPGGEPGRAAAAAGGQEAMPADKAAAVGEVAGSTAGHVDPEAARILAEQQASESQQRLDARWRPIRQEEGQQAAEREAEARSAARAAAAARQPAPRTSSGAEIVAAQPSVPSEQLKSLRADEELANRSAGIEDAGEHAAPGAQAATGGRTGAEEAGKAATAKAARAAGAAAGVAGAGAVAGGAAGAAQGAAGAAGSGAADAALAKAMQRADEAHAAGSGAGQGTVADRGAAAGAAAGQPERAEGAGQPDGGGQRPTPVGSMKLKPTPPASVRSADGFSPIILAPENMARLGALCEQPIDLCGQKVFDELFSPESFSELSPGQVQRERFIYADGPVVSAVYLVTLVNLPDDALLGERIRIEFVRRGSGWVAVAAGRQLRCRSGKVGINDWTARHCGEDPEGE